MFFQDIFSKVLASYRSYQNPGNNLFHCIFDFELVAVCQVNANVAQIFGVGTMYREVVLSSSRSRS